MATLFASVRLSTDFFVGLFFCQKSDLIKYSALHKQVFLNEEGYFIKSQHLDYNSFIEILADSIPKSKSKPSLICIANDKLKVKNTAFDGVTNKNDIGPDQYLELAEKNLKNIKKATSIFLKKSQETSSKENKSFSDYFDELKQKNTNQEGWLKICDSEELEISYLPTQP